MRTAHICILLDRSGSMESMKQEAVDMMNEQIAGAKKEVDGLTTKLSLITFGSEVDIPFFFDEDPLYVNEYDDYVPSGGTAMYDAVGSTISKFKGLPDYSNEDHSFLMIIISDGMENASRTYTSAVIAEDIKSLQNSNRWTFVYLGANQDLTKVSEALNIPVGNMMSFMSSGPEMVVSTKAAAAMNMSATTSYRSSVGANIMRSTKDFYNPGEDEEVKTKTTSK